jgi:protoporphyrinogen oxidase
MKNILIIGGGIVGITAAYFAKKKNSNVVLVEASSELGGLLKSDCNKYGCFDYGTHVASKTGIDELDNFLFSDFTEQNSYQFNIGRSGNFFNGRLSNTSPYVNTNFLSVDIYEQGCAELLNSNNQIGKNLQETLINRYGKTFYQHIFKGLIHKIFDCKATNLANECLGFFDMSRLLAFDKETTDVKKKDEKMDDKLGFHSATIGVEKIYPKTGGIGEWVKYLEKKLINRNIEIKTQSQITDIKVKSGKFFVTIGDNVLEADELVWTLSSGLLNRFIPTNTIGSRPNFRKTAIYDFVFDGPLDTKSDYINVYDESLLSSRVTCYQNLQKDGDFFACTVEVLQGNSFDFEKAIGRVQAELFNMGIVQSDSHCVFSQCRILEEGFPTLTNTDIKNLKSINQFYQEEHKNITLLGRSSAKGFFMSELLISAYKETLKQ